MSVGSSWGRPIRLVVVLGLNLALVGALVAVGIMAHSLGVFAEGGDYLADAAAIGASILAIWLSKRPPTPARPHGYPKATTWAALVNSGWLLLLAALVSAAAINRLVSGTGRGARLARADREQCRRAGHGGRCSHPQG